jgi:hypothetical protein
LLKFIFLSLIKLISASSQCARRRLYFERLSILEKYIKIPLKFFYTNTANRRIIRQNKRAWFVYIDEHAYIHATYGASVAKWLAHLPFTSEAAGSSLSENFLNATRTQSSCEKSKSQRSAESRGFPPGTPVSSHRES